ncbi:MAG: hypothetical protein EOO99_02655 [Pedobacter sp.]|nr:MAG: hypothetical protein EOO99_02655 [Pedobacter sp.]
MNTLSPIQSYQEPFTQIPNKQAPIHTLKAILLIAMLCVICFAPFLKAQDTKWPIKFGKYSCSASKYRNGSYEFIPRGSIVLKADGSYTYLGFEKPSVGKFKINKEGNIDFIGGYLDKGNAEKMDRINKFYIVFPTNPDNRWTASLN